MKTFSRILSYTATALVACAVTLFLCAGKTPGVSKLDQVEYLIENRFIGEADMEKAEDAAASAMISSLGDRWSYYLSAQEYADHKEQTENAYVGIGVTITADENEEGFLVIDVQPGGSAHEAGILTGDIIVSAGGETAKGLTVSELRNLIRGPEGTTVELEILRESEILPFRLERRQILTEVVSCQMLDGNIGLIAIRNFDARCAQESIAAIEALREQGATALIFDVRNNPGGYATELVELLDYLLPEGDLFRSVSYDGKEEVDTSDADFLDMPMAVLVNGNTYSAAEFFAAALMEYEAAVVVGEPTVGKGYYQQTIALGDGSAVALSTGKYYTPKGNSLADKGITPSVRVDVDEETASAIYYGTLQPADDPQIRAAIQALK